MRLIIFLYFFMWLNASLNAQQLSKQDEQFVDSIMNVNYRAGEPGAVLLIARKGQPIYRKAYGLANLEFDVPNKPEYIFRIASMSKQFTAVCILKLAQEGKLDLQDDIKKYLPDYNTHGERITIENLLTHTNGINDFVEKREFAEQAILTLSPEEIMHSFMNDSLTFEPGTAWGYSNSGYVVAGVIVEKVSGMPLSQYLQQHIFNPLGMSHTLVGTSDSLVKNAVYGYNIGVNGKFKPIEYSNWSWSYAAGDILSSVDDLLKWDNALYTETILKKEWLEKAWKSSVLPNGQKTNYGMGWTSNQFEGLQYLEHAGGQNGFSSDGIRVLGQQLYIVLLSNKTLWPVPLLSSVALRMVGQKEARPVAKQINRKTLQGYTGVYAINSSFYAKPRPSGEPFYQYVMLGGDTLFAQSPGNPKVALLPVGKDLFVPVWWANSYYQFRRNEQGQVTSVELYHAPFQMGPHDVQQKTSLPLPKEKQAIKLNAKKLELLTGKYDFGGGLILPVTIEGNRFYFQQPGQGKEEFFAENDTNFFSKATDVTLEFVLTNNVVSGIKVKVQGAIYEGKKIE